MRECRQVIEIGGYRGNVITSFLRGHHEEVTVFSLDEEFEPVERHELNGAPCRVRHIRDYFQAHAEVIDSADRSLGLVVLGLEIHGDLQPFLALLQRSRVAVLEAAQDYAPGLGSMTQVLASVNARTVCCVDLDLSANEHLLREELALNMNRPFWRRRLHVIEPVPAHCFEPLIDKSPSIHP